MATKVQSIAFVPARAGSKSIPGKNIKNFCGKVLIHWVLDALQNSDIDKIVVATDGEDIKKAVRELGFSKVELYDRLPENAQDHSSTESVMLEYLSNNPQAADNLFMLIQATSPWTRAEDINNALDMMQSGQYDSLLSAVEDHGFLWNKNGQSINYDFRARPRRQDMSPQYRENGALYLNTVANILKHKNRLSGTIGILEMPQHSAIELDSPDDWFLAETIMMALQK